MARVKSLRKINLGAEGKIRSNDLISYYHNVMPSWWFGRLFSNRTPLYHGGIFSRSKMLSTKCQLGNEGCLNISQFNK